MTVSSSNAVDLDSSLAEFTRRIEDFCERGSGYTLEEIKGLTLHVGVYHPLVGSSWVETPSYLRLKHCIRNIRNIGDSMCFVWSILACLFPIDRTKHPNKIHHYKNKTHHLNLTDLTYPVSLPDINIFERNNPSISVNVFECTADEKHEIILLRATKFRNREHHVNLLLLTDPEDPSRKHYTLITRMSALVAHRTKYHGKTYVCSFCLHPYTTPTAFDNHIADCLTHTPQRILLPRPSNPRDCTVQFRAAYRTEPVPYVIYFDTESILVDRTDDDSSIVTEHIPCGVCAYTVTIHDDEEQSKPRLFHGPDCIEDFFDWLIEEESRISAIVGRNVAMLPLSKEQEAMVENATHCGRCNEEFTPGNVKTRHHCHVSGRLLGALCNSCNLACKPRSNKGRKRDQPWHSDSTDSDDDSTDTDEYGETVDRRKTKTKKKMSDEEWDKTKFFYIPIIAHNLSGYDSHHILQRFNKRLVKTSKQTGGYSFKNVRVIAKNSEKFVTFSILNKRFIDSFQFLSASLDTLVQNLLTACDVTFDKFIHTKRHMNVDKLFFQKQVYCYEYMDSFERFKETELPPKECFFSRLTNEGISDEDYEQAKELWTRLDCKTLQDYHDAYLTLDTLLLADVFENLRRLGQETYGLDAAHYVTGPGFCWDACLKYTGVTLDLITDPEMHLFIESGIRGGVSTVNHRHARANNPYLEDGEYDASKPNSYIILLDANNLYGWALVQALPARNFKFLTPDEWENIDFRNVPDDGPTGYILEVDLKYGDHLHDTHNCYPLAPEKLQICTDMLSDYSKSFDMKIPKMEKLVPNLHDKVRYITHYRNLKLYLSLGMELIKIRRVMTFDQEPWVKPYVDLNTELRKNAKTEFEKSFYKLCVNCIFGKSLQNNREHRNSKLICNPTSAIKVLASERLTGFKIINKDLILFDEFAKFVKLDRPIFTGFSVLELSKLLMYQFHYNVMQPKYGDNMRLLFTDTDSLCYQIKTADLPSDLMSIKDDYLDTSNYPHDHSLFSKKNARVYGYFKNEISEGKEIIEFVGLKSKNYSILISRKDNLTKMTAKGIKKGYVKQSLRHEQYLRTLKDRVISRAKFQSIRSKNHHLFTVKNDKICLTAYDDKRYIQSDGISTLAYGHHKIR